MLLSRPCQLLPLPGKLLSTESTVQPAGGPADQQPGSNPQHIPCCPYKGFALMCRVLYKCSCAADLPLLTPSSSAPAWPWRPQSTLYLHRLNTASSSHPSTPVTISFIFRLVNQSVCRCFLHLVLLIEIWNSSWMIKRHL